MIRHKKETKKSSILYKLFALSIILSFIGLIFIFESSSVRSFSEYSNSFHYLKMQSIWLVLGIAALIFFSFFDYHKLYYLAFSFMMMTIILLIFVLIPGIGNKVGGARRWFDLGFFNVQPTELAKFSVILYLSSWLVHRERKRFFAFIAFIGILMFLIVLQPDMGTAIIVFSLSVFIYFLAGIELWYLAIFLPLSFFIFYFLIKLSPYRFNRLLAFFDPSRDPLGITYHINQILISLANGGILGRGLGASRQKYLFLPEAHTDSIFAIVGEEFGFFGGLLIILTFLVFFYYLFRISQSASDRFGRLLAGGIFVFFNLQVVINLAAIVNLIPLTGIPLPFMSYGGSNLLISFSLLGIAINIARQSRTI